MPLIILRMRLLPIIQNGILAGLCWSDGQRANGCDALNSANSWVTGDEQGDILKVIRKLLRVEAAITKGMLWLLN